MASTPASQSASRTQAATAMVCALFLGVVLYKVSSGEDNEPRVIVTAVAHRPAAAGTDSVPNATKECEALFEASLQRWQQRKAKRLDYLQKQPAPASKVTYYDVFEPEWNCEVEDRIGRDFGDGGKFVCGIDTMAADPNCLVYSVGSNLDSTFEQDVRTRTKCEIHTFDPTIDVTAMESVSKQFNFKVHAVGLGPIEKPFSRGVVKPLSNITASLGHTDRLLNILKVDCEGCEFEAFKSIFEECAAGKVKIGQLQIELHSHSTFVPIQGFFEGADKCGLMIFHKERNHWGCSGYLCVEFSLISKAGAWTAFKASHCPNA